MKKQLLLIIALTTLTTACKDNNNSIKPQIKPLIEAVYASGFVVAKDEYEIISQAEGYVIDKLVQDGDAVKKGDPLFIISAEQQTARNKIARETYEQAAKNYRDDSPVMMELKTALDASRTKMKFDSLNYIRYKNLIEQNATSRIEFDKMKLTYENSRNEFYAQQSRYEKIKSQLSLDLQNASNNLVITSDEAGRSIIRSEVDGLIFMTAKDKGELIRRGEVVAVAGKKDAYYLQLNVDELDAHRIKIGQSVITKIDAYPDKTFKAEISRIYPLVDRKQQSVRVDAILKEKLPSWFSGLALEANIIIRQNDKALVVPRNSILPGDSIMVDDNGEHKKVKVVTGVQTLDEVEIVSGLDTGNQIVLAK